MSIKDEMEARLRAAFAPSSLEILNESHLHAGHSGDDGTGESHFRLHIRAEELASLSRVARHRRVLAALGDIPSRIHALAMDIG